MGSVESNINTATVVALVVLVPVLLVAVWPFQREALALRARARAGESLSAGAVSDFGRRYRTRLQIVFVAAVPVLFALIAVAMGSFAAWPFLLVAIPAAAIAGWVASWMAVSQLRRVRPDR